MVCGSVQECDQITEIKIKQILRDGSIKCLVILDGLDEYKVPDTCRVRGFPNSDGLVNCTILCTMRPWRMINLQLVLDSTCDKMVQILGLKDDSINAVMSSILVNFYGLKKNSLLYKEKLTIFKIKSYRQDRSLMKIPLMLTASCLVWYEEGDVPSRSEIYCDESYFMTHFYLKLSEMTITRAENKHTIVQLYLEENRQNTNTPLDLPNILSEFHYIVDFFDIIKPVGRLALQDLMSDEPHLVFPRHKLEREIGQSKVELALKTGILSQAKAPGLSYQQRVSFSFYHKSIQEFVAALVIASQDREALTSFYTHCNSVEKVMELSNMIIFVFGLDPEVGCQLSDHLKNFVNSDADIIQHRKNQHSSLEGDNKIREMYRLQCKWFNEMKHNLSFTNNTDCKATLHVCDVHLSFSDDVSVASELVSMKDNSIVSVEMHFLHHPFHSILKHLPACKHLTTLYLEYCGDAQSNDLLSSVLLQLEHLQNVTYSLDSDFKVDGTAVVRAMDKLPALKSIEFASITLTDKVVLNQKLETVSLIGVQPTHFIIPSLLWCRQLRYIRLWDIELTNTMVLTCMEQLDKLVLRSVKCAHFILSTIHQCSQLTHLVLQWFALTGDVKLPSQLQTLKLCEMECAHFILSSLQGCTHLTSLEVEGLSSTEDCKLLARVLPQLIYLQYVSYKSFKRTPEEENVSRNKPWQEYVDEVFDEKVAGNVAIVNALQTLTRLRKIKLEYVGLHDAGTLLLTPHMTQLEKVKLERIVMSPRRWQEFISSLLKVQHEVHVKLGPFETNIDSDTVSKLHSSPQFAVSEETRYGTKYITFHAVH